MDFGIRDKVAVITGGGSGIGRATADLLATEGVKLALVGRTREKLKQQHGSYPNRPKQYQL